MSWFKQNLWKVIVFILIIVFIPIFHYGFYNYTVSLNYWLKLDPLTKEDNLDIGILGDSLAALGFLALVFSLILNIKELKENRKESKIANELRKKTDINQNIRELMSNLEKDSDGKEIWHIGTKNLLLRANISIFAEDSGSILNELLWSGSEKLREFATGIIKKNTKEINYSEINMSSINLSNANLKKVNLYKARLSGANLNQAYLHESNLCKANLINANLCNAKFYRAKLCKANLSGANLCSADLTEANLNRADLTNIKGLTVDQLLKAKTWKDIKLDTGFNSKFENEVKKRKNKLIIKNLIIKTFITFIKKLNTATFHKTDLTIQEEINENYRILMDNLKSFPNNKEMWDIPEINKMVKGNFSLNISNAGEILRNLLMSKSKLLHDFAMEVMEENSGKINLANQSLIGLDLSTVKLLKANLSNVNLINGNLSESNLFFANLNNSQLQEVNLSKAELGSASLINADLSQANLTDAVLYQANLSGATLSRAHLLRAVLSKAILNSANLSEANLCGAYLHKTQLNKAILSKAEMILASFKEANLNRADLSEANLNGAILMSANLIKVDLSNTWLSRTKFMDADLSGANLSGANLSEANLSGANLSGANLSGANLSEANLSEARGLIIDQLLTVKTLQGVKEENLDQKIWNEINNIKPELFVELDDE